jgi:hypothetical protein
MLDKRLSGKHTKVFAHKDKQKVIVAHRGSHGWAGKRTDIAAVIGAGENSTNASSMYK